MAYRRFSAGLAFDATAENVYFVSNMSGQFNLWRVSVDGGWPAQLTAFTDDTVRLIAVSPRDGTIAFCADHDGDEFHQIYLLDPNGGWPEKLTRHLESGDVRPVFGEGKYAFPGPWSPDGAKLVGLDFRSNSDSTLHVIDLDT